MPKACSFIKKETLTQVFPRESCEICKNTFSYRTHLVAASVQKTWTGRNDKYFAEITSNGNLR